MRRIRSLFYAQSTPLAEARQVAEKAWVHPRLWYPDTGEDEPSVWKDSERLLFEQSDRIDAAVARLRPGDPGRPSVFFVGFAGTGEQKVFAEEANSRSA
jgi:hypothetical protein